MFKKLVISFCHIAKEGLGQIVSELGIKATAYEYFVTSFLVCFEMLVIRDRSFFKYPMSKNAFKTKET